MSATGREHPGERRPAPTPCVTEGREAAGAAREDEH
jgi:hypothetical protein